MLGAVTVPKFDIDFIGRGRPSRALARGRLVLADFAEVFEASLEPWDRRAYRRHWREAITRIIDGSERSALVTSWHDPASANFIRWWPMYRRGPAVVFHEHLLIIEDLPGGLPIDLFEAVPSYASTTDEGEPISEWRLPVDALADYLGRTD
jgi:hypothetical protein